MFSLTPIKHEPYYPQTCEGCLEVEPIQHFRPFNSDIQFHRGGLYIAIERIERNRVYFLITYTEPAKIGKGLADGHYQLRASTFVAQCSNLQTLSSKVAEAISEFLYDKLTLPKVLLNIIGSYFSPIEEVSKSLYSLVMKTSRLSYAMSFSDSNAEAYSIFSTLVPFQIHEYFRPFTHKETPTFKDALFSQIGELAEKCSPPAMELADALFKGRIDGLINHVARNGKRKANCTIM